MRRMYDSTNPKDIPPRARLIGAYVDGYYANTKAVLTYHPKAKLVTITVTGQANANVVDCEPGDTTPTSAAAWAAAEVAAGRTPTIYCMASQWGLVKQAVAQRGITGKVNYWIADYDGDPTIPPGAVAKQYLGSPGNSPGHYDVSSVAAYWPGVDHPIRKAHPANLRALVQQLIRLLQRRSK